MNDIAEKLLEAIAVVEDVAARAAVEGTGKWTAEDPSFWFDDEHPMCRYEKVLISLHDPDSVARRCAADREIVDHFRNLVAKYRQLKSSARESLDEEIELRTVEARIADFAAVILPALARGYGIQP